MSDEACFYTVMHAPQENHERILREMVAPVVSGVRDHPDLDSLFFVRYNVPDWQIRFRVLGRPRWVEGPVRERIETALRPLLEAGSIERVEFGTYDREWDRYGGPEGMALAERIFLHDSIACLDLIEAESRGELTKSRREYSLLHTERLLDLMRFDRAQRLAFYRMGYQWAIDQGQWTPEDIPRLERQYAKNRDGFRALLASTPHDQPEAQFGGVAPAQISRTCLDSTRPVIERLLEAHAAGRIAQDLVPLAWSYAHMHANRLGIETVPEAILRYFMYRFYEETDPSS